jgi:hypothetical protein
MVEHGGQTDGMHAQLALVPELGLGVVVLSNSVLLGYPAAIGYRMVDASLNRSPRDWAAVTLERWPDDTYRPGWEPGLIASALPLATFERNGRGDVGALRGDATGEFERVGDRP